MTTALFLHIISNNDQKYLFVKLSESESRSVVSDSLQPQGLSSPWNSPGQNTGRDSLSLLQWIFLTQELNQGLLHCRWILHQLSYEGNLMMMKNLLIVEHQICTRHLSFIIRNLHKFFTNYFVDETIEQLRELVACPTLDE